ncbi:hypothetical protein QFC21_000777 [Naganishia friedmannii]|uniref:Uncharacterized protein n=1 Tax=Naganishia friedmannii TaxID=89922 RepID=A0ACC2W9N6_9TREE|nr:hypothetical protein QFC21_000777 [Naganishia friedmannii]
MRVTLPRSANLPPTLRQLLSNPPTDASHTTASSTTVQGWIKSIRAHKNVAFIEVSDGTTSDTLQAVLKGKGKDSGSPSAAISVEGLSVGTSIKINGRIQKSRGAGQACELLVDDLAVLGACDSSYPIQKKHLPPDVLRDHAHLRFRTSQIASTVRLRDTMMREWHDYFEDADYTFIHTPILTSSDCEGAGETFRVTTDPLPRSPTPSTSTNPKLPTSHPAFFPNPAYLTVSSQLHLEAPTHAVSRTYTLSPTFRAEPSATSRHLAEFYMLEAEVAFVETLDELMSTVEDGIRRVLNGLVRGEKRRAARARDDLRIVESSLRQDHEEKRLKEAPLNLPSPLGVEEADPIDRLRQFADKSFVRITYTEAVAILQQQHAVQPFEYGPEWGASLQTEHEKYLAGEKFGAPVFVTDYPRSLKPFYMRLNDESGSTTPSPTVACFDLLVPGIGELVGGSLREERLPYLERAIEHAGLEKESYDWYLDLRRYGSVKHGGWGMGWERFVCWVTGVGNIRDVVAFPRWKGNCRY